MKDMMTEVLEKKYAGKEYNTSLLVGKIMGNLDGIEIKKNGSETELISMEPDGESYLYTFEIETENGKHAVVSAHVHFDFPYNAEMPVGYDKLYIRLEHRQYEIVAVMQNQRLNIIGLVEMQQGISRRYDLSNGAKNLKEKASIPKEVWEQKAREIQSLQRQDAQIQRSGHISSDVATVLGLTPQMNLSNISAVTMEKEASLADYQGKKLVTDDNSAAIALRQFNHGGHKMILIDPPRTVCSCCGSPLIIETQDKIKCRECNSVIDKILNKTRNMVTEYFENGGEEECGI